MAKVTGVFQKKEQSNEVIAKTVEEINEAFETADQPKEEVVEPHDTLLTKFLSVLKTVENGGLVGYDERKDRWYPHKSVEGGTDTIGYGHKMSVKDVRLGTVQYGGLHYPVDEGVPDGIIEKLFTEDVLRAERLSYQQWQEENFATHYTDLPEKYQLLLTEIVFNVGTLAPGDEWGWPKLANAMLQGNDTEVRKEAMRGFLDPKTNQWVQLTTRVNMICDALGIDG